MQKLRQLFFPIVSTIALLAALALAYLGAKSTTEAEQLTMKSLIEGTTRLASEKVDRIERKLIDTENVLLDLMTGVDESGFQQRWNDYVGPSPFVKSVILLGTNGSMSQVLTSRPAEARDTFLTLLNQEILPALEVERWPLGMLKHLHVSLHGKYYLFAWQRRSVWGTPQTTLLEIDMDNILGDIFPKTFDALSGEFQYMVQDQDGTIIYGKPTSGRGPFTASFRFPSTLYRWTITISPVAAASLEENSSSQSIFRYALLIFSTLLAVLGVGGILYTAIQERKLNVLKTDFISNVSHELKTPLSLIRMFSEMLAKGHVTHEKKVVEYHGILHRESERLALLIENVLDFARIEGGRKALVQQEFDLNELARRACQALRPRLEQDGHSLWLETQELSLLRGDAETLLLAVQNLLDNAGKFAEAPCDVKVKTWQEGSEVFLSVEDTGPGIPEEDLPRIFERFFRGKRSGNRSVRGSGIGLALVQSAVRQHQGRIRAESTVGKGSRFVICLPREREKQA